ncbi:unnamed protein product [Merluccius merluccius]
MSREEEEVVEGGEGQRGSAGLLAVFEGSSPGDASHARRLWGSVSLLPPLESRLISADIRQRLPVARSSAGPGATRPGKPRRGGGQEEKDVEEEMEVQEEERRRRCEAMAVRREEILGLLRSQRERRQRREAAGGPVGPGVKERGGPASAPREARGLEADREAVHQLG